MRRLLVTFLTVALAFCGLAGGARAQTATTIRIATTPIDLGAEALYAADLGFFKRAGLDVEVNLLASGSTVAAAVSGGSIDIGQSNIVALASAHAAGLPFVIVAPAGYYTSAAPTTQLVTAANSPITGAKDLDGKIIAVTALKDLNWVSIQSWLQRGGADLASIKYVEIQQPAACSVVTSGRAAAAIVSEPYLSFALRDGGCRVLAPTHDAIAKQFLVGAWFSTTAWAAGHPDAIRRFRAVMVETARWAATHHAESARILERYTHLEAPPEMKRVPFAERAEAAQIQPVLDAAARFGVFPAFPASELLLP
ncbi:MAG: ABC transporter substrate-binding protein [Candidatus Lustribacter sp.]|jgi:NitT/TauT family transport system substrate-binding protein